jgi:N-acetylglucosamine-6-phosphate deacetylase
VTQTAILNGKVYTPSGILEPGAILLDGGKIKAIAKENEISVPDGTVTLDARDLHVVPGFVDVHIHGLLGHDSMGPGLKEIISSLPAYGVTSFLATTLTRPKNQIMDALDEMANILASPPLGANCLGIHMEGPHLSPAHPGMATSDWFQPLTWQELASFQKAADGNICMLTFAPEEGQAIDLIPKILQAGMVPSIGHSDASFEQVEQAVNLGLSHASHTYNAMRPMAHRQPGVVGAVMYFDQIYAELIADGIHVHPAAMKTLYRSKGPHRLVLVSDASPLAGLPQGTYKWHNKQVIVEHGACRLDDGTIAGAHALIDSGVRNLVNHLDLPLEEALLPATQTAADSLGLHKKGRILAGCDADLVFLDDEIRPVATIVRGELIWERDIVEGTF